MRALLFAGCIYLFLLQTGSSAAADDLSRKALHESFLFQSCQKAVENKNYFESSYCSHAIVGILMGYTLTLYHTPPSTNQLCELEALRDILGRVYFTVPPIKVAENFLKWVDGKSPSAKFLFIDDVAEVALVSSIAATYAAKEVTLNELQSWIKIDKEIKGKWIRKYLKTRDLYLSCSAKEFHPGDGSVGVGQTPFRDFCDGTVRGLTMGYALAVNKMPSYGRSDKCHEKKNQLVSDFSRRMCLRDAGHSPAWISENFVNDVKEMPPERIMVLGSDRPAEWVLASYVIKDCGSPDIQRPPSDKGVIIEPYRRKVE